GLHSVTDDTAPAVLAGRRHRVDRALEAIERPRPTPVRDLERLSVIVSAHVTTCHWFLLDTAPRASRRRRAPALQIWRRRADLPESRAAIPLHRQVTDRQDADDSRSLLDDGEPANRFRSHHLDRLGHTRVRRHGGEVPAADITDLGGRRISPL